MRTQNIRWIALLVFVIGLSCTSIAWFFQASTSVATVPVSMSVSVEAKRGKEVPIVYKEDVRAYPIS